MKHWAFNLLTLEAISSNNGNYLKKLLKAHKRCNGAGKWVFSHNGVMPTEKGLK